MERPKSWSRALVLLCGAGLVAAWPLSAQASGPCETDDSYQGLDFLLGEWRLVSGGETVGRSRVEKLEDGCLVAETWSLVDGGSGRTYSSFDPVNAEWRRFSVSSGGVVVRSDGAIDGDELVIDGLYVSADGEMSYWHERLTPTADGRVARIAGLSTRVGRGERPSTVLFEGHYVPAGRPEPRPVETAAKPPAPADAPGRVPVEPPGPTPVEPAPPARVATAPAAGGVTPGSARAVDAAAIERIAMASPMVLRLPLGAVESLPEGYGWVTRDTAPYICEGVTIQGVQVERRVRRGRVELEVELAVQGSRAARRVNIGVDLRRGGRPEDDAPVASGATAGRVGRNIPEQIEHGSVAFELPLSMEAAIFDEIVADAERPELVITLAVDR